MPVPDESPLSKTEIVRRIHLVFACIDEAKTTTRDRNLDPVAGIYILATAILHIEALLTEGCIPPECHVTMQAWEKDTEAEKRLELIKKRVARFREEEQEDQAKTVISDPHPFLDPLLDDIEELLKD